MRPVEAAGQKEGLVLALPKSLDAKTGGLVIDEVFFGRVEGLDDVRANRKSARRLAGFECEVIAVVITLFALVVLQKIVPVVAAQASAVKDLSGGHRAPALRAKIAGERGRVRGQHIAPIDVVAIDARRARPQTAEQSGPRGIAQRAGGV